MTCPCGGDCSTKPDMGRVEALKIALQTMPGDRVRDPQDLVRRAEIVHQFLTNATPAEGSRQAS